jgi:hypothetical protein
LKKKKKFLNVSLFHEALERLELLLLVGLLKMTDQVSQLHEKDDP